MALDLLRKQSSVNPAFKRLMQLKMHYNTAIYVEFHINENAMLYEKLIQVGELISNCGGNEEDTWVARNSQDMERLHHFRHSIPEAVNLLIDSRRKKDPVITKLGTDMAVPDKHLEQIVELYNKDLAASGLDSVMFGHIGNNHIHVNILPNSMEEYLQGKNLYSSWATQVISLGGTVSAEHGVGKLKTALLKEMYGEDGISQMKLLKMVFDPDIRLNKGSLFN